MRVSPAARLLGLGLICCLSGCVDYLGVQGVNQLKLLAGREPITEVMGDSTLTAEQLAQLGLIVDVQVFAAEAMGMEPSGTYTSANMSFTNTIYNVSACEPLAFEPYLWWFPIVGHVPYKGFFRAEDARRLSDKLSAKGLEVVMRPVSAYSTLGFFDDPVLPSMLDYSQAGLVDLILHELAHGVLYFKGQVSFNESFASFVGKYGAYAYLASAQRAGLPTIVEAEQRYADSELHQAFMRDLYERLERIYSSDSTGQDMLEAKAAALDSAALRYAEVPFLSVAYQGRALGDVNNATLMSYQRYHSGEAGFRDLLDAVGGDWPAFFQAVEQLKTHPDPFAGVHELAALLRPEAP